eukprot:COSAG04_NODE_447_length_14267_cov_17.958569_10_plen_416_part_00
MDGALLAAEPEPEPEPSPLSADALSAPRVVVITADGAEGELISFRRMADMLHGGELNGDSSVFVPPAELESGAQFVDSLVDMEEVREMDAEDLAELAASLEEQLAPEDGEAGDEAEATLVIEGVDEIDRACAACAPPLQSTLFGHFRAPVELPPALAAQAERVLGETPEVRTAALAELREKMAATEKEGVPGKKKKDKRREIFFPRKDDQFMIAFLRNQKFRVDDALARIIAYTEFLDENAALLGCMNPKDDPILNPAHMAKLGFYALPGTDRKGGRALAIRLGEIPHSLFEELEVKKHRELLYKLQIRQMIFMMTRFTSDAHAQVMGLGFVEDWADHPSFKLMMKMDGILSGKQKKVVFSLFSGVLPIKMNGFYFLNQPKFMSVLLALAKPFMSKKLRERFCEYRHFRLRTLAR